jgi:hypothetical protein
MARSGLVAVGLAMVAAGSFAQAPDPRSAEGQLAACGGATAWRALGYLEFEVKITGPGAASGSWHYNWDRQNGYLRLSGPGKDGGLVEAAMDIGSRTGGGWENGQQVTGPKLAQVINWALQRFAEDVLWLTFPLEWREAGVKVTPQPDVTDSGANFRSTEIVSPMGRWVALLDPATGLVSRTVLERKAGPTLTVRWEGWQPHAGVMFAHRRTIVETGEKVEVDVKQALPRAPEGVF